MAKVLIIEDNKEIRRVYERAFHLGGYEVECIENGLDAMARLKTGRELPAIVLLDVIIPGLSGIDVLRGMKAEEQLKHIPIIILTNSLGDDDKELFLSHGADRFIIKLDNDPREVVGEVSTILGRT